MAFEGILAPPDKRPSRWRRIMVTVSLALHGIGLVVGVIVSLWKVDELPMPAIHVTLANAPPPPPPPPPPPKKSASTKPKTKPTEAKPSVLTAPKEIPKEEPKPEPEAAKDDDDDKGVEGGVEGGVAGGVLGGVVGAAPPPPPPKPVAPTNVPLQIARQQLLINPDVDPYKVRMPPALARSGATSDSVVRICVSKQGNVTGVSIVKPGLGVIDQQLPTVIRRWRYRPIMKNGEPIEFCYVMRYELH
ncbi:MAG TPA: TonB family protein [Polyangiaceae bacterium]|nr:TonB family protein [Polyangiaceae bacterium]